MLVLGMIFGFICWIILLFWIKNLCGLPFLSSLPFTSLTSFPLPCFLFPSPFPSLPKHYPNFHFISFHSFSLRSFSFFLLPSIPFHFLHLFSSLFSFPFPFPFSSCPFLSSILLFFLILLFHSFPFPSSFLFIVLPSLSFLPSLSASLSTEHLGRRHPSAPSFLRWMRWLLPYL